MENIINQVCRTKSNLLQTNKNWQVVWKSMPIVFAMSKRQYFIFKTKNLPGQDDRLLASTARVSYWAILEPNETSQSWNFLGTFQYILT